MRCGVKTCKRTNKHNVNSRQPQKGEKKVRKHGATVFTNRETQRHERPVAVDPNPTPRTFLSATTSCFLIGHQKIIVLNVFLLY